MEIQNQKLEEADIHMLADAIEIVGQGGEDIDQDK